MLNKHSLVIFLLILAHTAFSQRQWTWVNGDRSATNVDRVYGTLRVAAPSNTPGGRIGAASWLDNQGNLWLFGGKANSGIISSGVLNDLWMYDTDAGQWTWMGGDKNFQSPGNYETKGVPSPANIPGARQNGISWTDNNGDFWLFGGLGVPADNSGGSGMLNDLWKYSPSTGAWTFVSGTDEKNENGRYGIRMQASSANYPGGRYSASGWTDNSGNLWLFGGRGYSSRNQVSLLDDVWRYSPSENSWTYMKGDETGNADVSYGQKAIFSDLNTPGGRHGCMSWVDNNGNFWLMGGGTLTDLFSDLWKYDPSNNQWSWFNGSNVPNESPVVTQRGVANPADHPGARTLSATWIDDNGDVWLFGGHGYGGQAGSNSLNDLWKYATATNQWAFLKGEISTNPTAVYGTKGIAAEDNTPGGMGSSSFWTDQQGHFWIFGGRSGNNYLDQLWRLSVNCPVPVTGSITPASAVICEGGWQVLTALGGTSYEWRKNGETIIGETKSGLLVTTPGTYSVIIKNGECSGPAANSVEVTLNTSTNGIRYADMSVNENVSVRLSARNNGTRYNWTPGTGLDDPTSATPLATLTADQQYLVNITLEQGCSVTDTQFVKVNAGNNNNNDKIGVRVPSAFTPNGNNVNDLLRPLGDIGRLNYFKVYNRWGNLLFHTSTIGDGWDGRHRGVLQPPESYTWILSVEMRDGKSVKTEGKTLLIR